MSSDPAAPGGFLRAPHGAAKAKGRPGLRVEAHAHDELPAAIDGRSTVAVGAGERTARGTFTRTGAAAAGRRGGLLARGGRPSLASSLGLSGDLVPSAKAFDPYRRRAVSYRRAHCAQLAQLAGGECGTGPSALVAQAALALAMSRYLYDLATRGGGTPDLGLVREARQMGDSARQHLLCAFELAIREGRARGLDRPGAYDPDAVTARAEAEAEQKRAKRRLPQVIDTKGE